ncbi:unnamed protein product [Cyprideis torosa]|uniref:Uncharacterized protein n=1 Tax=Cyprideis torosa TaxID=163714 RepID=A0A7R8WW52_9CRUS|nr:unnamed protein product [Cyprideis torosa]CAG0911402.1 unnamed protein product [Cyprideis torosa]
MPGQLVERLDDDIGVIAYDGLKQRANLAFVPEAAVGDYVLVHAGFAISRLDADEAERSIAEFRALEASRRVTDPTS